MEKEPRKLRKEFASLLVARFRSEPDRRFTATERRGYSVGGDPSSRITFTTGDYRTAWSGFTIPVSMLTRFASSTESVPASGTAAETFRGIIGTDDEKGGEKLCGHRFVSWENCEPQTHPSRNGICEPGNGRS